MFASVLFLKAFEDTDSVVSLGNLISAQLWLLVEVFRDSDKVKPFLMLLKIIVSCPAHTGLINCTQLGLLLSLAIGSVGDVKQ